MRFHQIAPDTKKRKQIFFLSRIFYIFTGVMERKSFKDYRSQVEESLIEAGYKSDSISNLLNCRELINGHLEYLRDLSSSYYEQSKVEESRYKESKAEVILSASSVNAGIREADKVDYSLKKDFINSESTYKRIRGFVDTLSDRDDYLKQKISYLKSEEQLNNYIK